MVSEMFVKSDGSGALRPPLGKITGGTPAFQTAVGSSAYAPQVIPSVPTIQSLAAPQQAAPEPQYGFVRRGVVR